MLGPLWESLSVCLSGEEREEQDKVAQDGLG
jgi:hypothetical protein